MKLSLEKQRSLTVLVGVHEALLHPAHNKQLAQPGNAPLPKMAKLLL
jgi:hypothetical protein